MLLGLGAVAVVGYLVYQNNKPKGFAGKKNAIGGALTVAPMGICQKGYKPDAEGNPIEGGTWGGYPIYECCGTGVVAFNPGTKKCQKKKGSPKSTTLGGLDG